MILLPEIRHQKASDTKNGLGNTQNRISGISNNGTATIKYGLHRPRPRHWRRVRGSYEARLADAVLAAVEVRGEGRSGVSVGSLTSRKRCDGRGCATRARCLQGWGGPWWPEPWSPHWAGVRVFDRVRESVRGRCLVFNARGRTPANRYMRDGPWKRRVVCL